MKYKLNSHTDPLHQQFEKVKDKISMTTPDQSYTIQELLDKHTQGIAPAVARQTMYSDDPLDFDQVDLDKVNQLDMVDRDALREQVKERVEKLDASVKRQRKAKFDRAVKLKADQQRQQEQQQALGKASEGSNEVNDAK